MHSYVRLRRSLLGIATLAATLPFVLPLLLLAGGALMPPGAAITPEQWRPQTWSLDALYLTFASMPFATGLLNSLWITTLAVPMTLAVAGSAAFALTQLTPRARLVWLIALLLAASLPLTALLIPRFVLFETLGLVGTPIPLLAPALSGGSPILVLLLYAAMRRIPQDQIDAARLEGLGWWSVLRRIALPQIRPTLAATAILATVLFWGSFIEPLLYLRTEREMTAPLMLHAMEMLGSTQWSPLLAMAATLTLPVAIVVLALHRLMRAPRWQLS